MSADRNLLFGVLALQMDFIDRDQLVKAMNDWTVDKNKTLGEILVANSAMNQNDRAMLEPMVHRHIELHDNDSAKSLATISSVESLRRDLSDLNESEVTMSIRKLGSTRIANEDSDATLSIGAKTSEGSRFTILRPHAKGGLGQVSVAKDHELDREVALKEIQEKYADDEESRNRFVLEAEITGGLEHPGIVPVYGVGQYSDGRPYYAMRFIRGASMKEAIRQLHRIDKKQTPDSYSLELRKLLGRLIDVCNAMGYAHARGVLHRDLKPGNIMLGKYGETLVVDWGLAKPSGESDPATAEPTLMPSSASGSMATQMGSAVGTPACMSPEQAAGRLEEMGPASDVYSLGATLYMILTGQAAFSGKDITRVLEKVQQGDFLKPSQIKSGTPKALEAICLKAMEKKIADRYTTPHELSEDLEKWLADEPVTAWREPLSIRTSRWLKRNRTLVTATAAAMVVALVGASVVLVMQKQANQKLLETNLALEQSYERETARFELAQKAIGLYHGEISQDLLLKQSQFKDLRTRLLKGAAEFYDELEDLLSQQSDPKSRAMLGRAYHELGDLTSEIGNKKQSLEVHQKGLQVHRAIAQGANAQPDEKIEVMRSLGAVAKLQNELGQFADSEKTYLEAIKSGEEQQANGIDSDMLLAGLGSLNNELGNLIGPNGKLDESLKLYGKAAALLNTVVDRSPDNQHAQREWAYACNNMGAVYLKTAKPKEALAEFERTLELRVKLVKKYPDQLDLKRDLAIAHANIGLAQFDLGANEKYLESIQKAHEIRQELVEKNPAVTEFRTDLARSFDDIGHYHLGRGDADESQKQFSKAAEIQKQVVETNPDVVEFRGHLARYYNNIGAAFGRTDMADALVQFQKAQVVQEEIVERFPTITRYQSELAQSIQNVGLCMRFQRDFEGAVKQYEQAIAVLEKVSEANPDVTQYKLDMSANLQNIAAVMNLTEENDKAIEALGKAIVIQEDLHKLNPENGVFARELGRSFNTRASAYESTSDLESAEKDYQRSKTIHEKLVASSPETYDYGNGLAYTLSGLGRVLAKLDRVTDAIDELSSAIDIRKKLPTLSSGAKYDMASNQCLIAKLAEKPDAKISKIQAAEYVKTSLEGLKDAIKSGYGDLDELKTDENFALLRDNDEFKKLVEDRNEE